MPFDHANFSRGHTILRDHGAVLDAADDRCQQ
jgi:hypothetical protein